MVKNIIFDGSGVLYTRSKEFIEFKKQFSELCGVGDRADELFTAWKKMKHNVMNGRLSLKDHISATCKSLGVDLTDSQAEKLVNEHIRGKTLALQDNTRGILSNLSEYNLYVLSNATVDSSVKKDILEHIGLSKFFKGIFTSLDLKSTKSSPDCFKTFFEATKISPRDSVFVGHRRQEMFGAKLAGLKTISLDSEVRADFNITSISELPRVLKKF